MLNQDELNILKRSFSLETLGVKIQSTSRDKSKAMLVLYLQHTDVMDRLEEVDPAWHAEAIEIKSTETTVYVRMRMTVKEVTRENVGDGNDIKGAYSDALKRCAMLFGVGRFLYDSKTVWVPYNETRDKYRTWTYEDYRNALNPNLARPAFVQNPAVKAVPHEAPKAPSSFPKPGSTVQKSLDPLDFNWATDEGEAF